jgi:hypothetical protein
VFAPPCGQLDESDGVVVVAVVVESVLDDVEPPP